MFSFISALTSMDLSCKMLIIKVTKKKTKKQSFKNHQGCGF